MIFALLKFVSRLTHMVTVGILGGSIILNFFFGEVIKESVLDHPIRQGIFTKVFAITGTLLIISGCANIFLIKGGKTVEDKYQYWYYFLALKFIIGLLVTPLGPKLFQLIGKGDWYWEHHTKIQFFLILLAYFLSTSAKWFREEVAHNFVAQKMKGE